MCARFFKMLFCLSVLILAGCNRPVSPVPTWIISTPPGPTSDAVPIFEDAECAFDIPEGFQPRCGYLTVPEDRNQPDGRTIRLHVAIFKSTNPNPAPDPVIHLAGGPGSSPLNNARPILMRGGQEILAQRDYILFDQRGTQYSEPYLYCLPYDEYLWDAHEQNISLGEYNSGAITRLDACREDWQKQAINLAAYNSVENAADVNDLRRALGYEQVNLYSTSYGTRLALITMRDHPEGIRSVILDSVFPPQVNLDLELASNAYRSLREVFQACAVDDTCSGRYGDIEAKFYEIIDRLEAAPAQLEVYGPYREQPYKIYLDGDLSIDTIFGALYSMVSIADIPYFIQAAYEETYSGLSDAVGGAIGSPLSTGLLWSTTCREEIPFETGLPESPESGEVPSALLEHFSPQYVMDTCAMWDVTAAAGRENEAVSSSIPTLVFSGRFDPVTPPSWGQLAAETLSQHYYYEFPNLSHGVMRSDACALQMGLSFLTDPLQPPDSSCMNELDSVEFR